MGEGKRSIADLRQKQADRHGREFANAFYSGGGEISTEWWCVEDMIENAPTIEPERKKGKWIGYLEPGNENYHCSACGTAWYPEDLYLGGNDFPKYCPECGAAMENWQTEYSMEEQE